MLGACYQAFVHDSEYFRWGSPLHRGAGQPDPVTGEFPNIADIGVFCAKGCGARLLQVVLTWLKEDARYDYLVVSSTKGARSWYTRQGFRGVQAYRLPTSSKEPELYLYRHRIPDSQLKPSDPPSLMLYLPLPSRANTNWPKNHLAIHDQIVKALDKEPPISTPSVPAPAPDAGPAGPGAAAPAAGTPEVSTSPPGPPAQLPHAAHVSAAATPAAAQFAVPPAAAPSTTAPCSPSSAAPSPSPPPSPSSPSTPAATPTPSSPSPAPLSPPAAPSAIAPPAPVPSNFLPRVGSTSFSFPYLPFPILSSSSRAPNLLFPSLPSPSGSHPHPLPLPTRSPTHAPPFPHTPFSYALSSFSCLSKALSPSSSLATVSRLMNPASPLLGTAAVAASPIKPPLSPGTPPPATQPQQQQQPPHSPATAAAAAAVPVGKTTTAGEGEEDVQMAHEQSPISPSVPPTRAPAPQPAARQTRTTTRTTATTIAAEMETEAVVASNASSPTPQVKVAKDSELKAPKQMHRKDIDMTTKTSEVNIEDEVLSSRQQQLTRLRRPTSKRKAGVGMAIRGRKSRLRGGYPHSRAVAPGGRQDPQDRTAAKERDRDGEQNMEEMDLTDTYAVKQAHRAAPASPPLTTSPSSSSPSSPVSSPALPFVSSPPWQRRTRSSEKHTGPHESLSSPVQPSRCLDSIVASSRQDSVDSVVDLISSEPDLPVGEAVGVPIAKRTRIRRKRKGIT
eukprot:g71565.t1